MRNFEIKQQKVMPVDRIKSLNSNVNNTQSMTNEEARQLTGKVAMTRALFESKENINSTTCSQWISLECSRRRCWFKAKNAP